MPRLKTIKTFTIDELDGAARETALAWVRDDSDGAQFELEWVVDSFVEVAIMLGIDITTTKNRGKHVWCSVSWSQGDGASFEGRWIYRAGSVADVVREYPTDTCLHDIAATLRDAARACCWNVYADVTATSRGDGVRVSVDRDRGWSNLPAGADDDITRALGMLAGWLYERARDTLEDYYDEKQCIERANANEWVFDVNGRIV